MDKRAGRLALYAGVLLVLVGLIVLYIGYNGAATHANVVQQVPYLVSGGFTGVILIVLGATGVLAFVLVHVQAGIREGLEVLDGSIREMTEALSHREFEPADNRGSGGELVSVTRGSSSFHRSECRLVTGKEGVRVLPRAEAERTGLLACRVCKP
ncbi:MAG TPA: hypothetical protein VNE62_10620 [Actinomycetota bacterium]|nr:hypothetical protein [Actinomycetota bacterium]